MGSGPPGQSRPSVGVTRLYPLPGRGLVLRHDVVLNADVEQLFTRVDAPASSGSHLAIEESAALPEEAFRAAVADERAARAEGDDRLFFQLIYNDQHDPAQQWFSEHGWTAVATPLADCLRDAGRPVPGPDIEAGPMIARDTLVRAVKK